MAIGAQRTSDLSSLLRLIFAESSLRISLAGSSEQDRRRNIAFYDEIIGACVRLSVPASHRTIPAPAPDAQTSFALPLLLQETDEDDNEDANGRNRPPLILAILIASLRVSLEAAYVPPRLARATKGVSLSDDAGVNDLQLIASVEADDSAYQDVSLQTGTATSEATRMTYRDWAGNSTPPTPELKKPCSKRGREAYAAKAEEASRANVWFGNEQGVDCWTVEWRCDIPIVFLRSRHPTPALVLNTTLTLHLQPSKLSALAPSLAPPATTTASEAVFLHDLLNPLSEGPAYPDESPAERAARADASLAKLPLGKLPSSVLGSKLITPARGANDLAKLLEKNARKRDGGDVAFLDASDLNRGDVDKGLGEEAVVVRRSARKALDVRSAVQVRMRTTNIAGVGEGFGEIRSGRQSEQDSAVPSLILCVEIENPINSGVKFALDDVGVHVAVPSETYGALHPATRIGVTATPIGFTPESLMIEQGSQFNLLFRVDFAMPLQVADPRNFDPTSLLSETQRTVTIELFGHPVLLGKADSGESFTSTWSCTLDFVTQIQALILQQVVADGAGGTALARLPNGSQIDAATVFDAATTAVPPSIVAQRRLESLQQPQTPTAFRSTSTRAHTDGRTISMGAAQARNASMRALNGEPIITLQQSADRSYEAGAEAVGPALPSSLVGPSILARARLNRHATMSSVPDGGARNASNGRGQRAATLVSTTSGSYARGEEGVTRAAGGHRRLPSRVTSASYHVQNAMSGNLTLDAIEQTLPVYPLGSKGSWTRMPYLLRNAAAEQGTLLDVTAIKVEGEDQGGRSVVDVHLQIDNRSDVTRTVLLQWRRGATALPKDVAKDVAKAVSAAKGEVDLLSLGWMPSDDAIQVGPIAPGQAELAMMRLARHSANDDGQKEAATAIPPLLLTDIGTGAQRTLISVQQICV